MKASRIPETRRTVRALVVVPDPNQPGLTAAEKLGLTVRADATITGRCACGAVAPPVRIRRGELHHMPLEHENDCPAISDALEALAKRMGDRLQFLSAVVELRIAA